MNVQWHKQARNFKMLSSKQNYHQCDSVHYQEGWYLPQKSTTNEHFLILITVFLPHHQTIRFERFFFLLFFIIILSFRFDLFYFRLFEVFFSFFLSGFFYLLSILFLFHFDWFQQTTRLILTPYCVHYVHTRSCDLFIIYLRWHFGFNF